MEERRRKRQKHRRVESAGGAKGSDHEQEREEGDKSNSRKGGRDRNPTEKEASPEVGRSLVAQTSYEEEGNVGYETSRNR